jgi:hypothetical protein
MIRNVRASDCTEIYGVESSKLLEAVGGHHLA